MTRRWPLALLALAACVETRGSRWIAEPLPPDDGPPPPPRLVTPPRDEGSEPGAQKAPRQRTTVRETGREGRSLGVFRNTYYDFPRESDYSGSTTLLRAPDCTAIAAVPRTFHDTVCVQGSGTLASGSTVSFARRDCPCAEVCPRSGQKICFEALDRAKFPWGRGATGKPIAPLRSVAVDSEIIPLGTVVYIAELDGVPRSEKDATPHDGCFVAEDRGSRVKGEHIDVFTGTEAATKYFNARVPSNTGVHVFVDDPRCAR